MVIIIIFAKNAACEMPNGNEVLLRSSTVRNFNRADNSDHKLTYYEKRLYPKQNFSGDTLLMRIERLEIALFGVISDEELLSERVLKIDSEMALLELNSPKKNIKLESKQHEEARLTELRREREMMREANLKRENRRRNYSMINPLLQGASQRLLRMM